MCSLTASSQPENFSSCLSKQFPYDNASPPQASAFACLQLPFCWPEWQQQINLWIPRASCAFKARLDVFNVFSHFPACRLLSNISGKAACDSSQFLWHFKATHMFNISTTSFPRASCFSCHSSFHAICIEWVIYSVTIVIYGTSQHLHGKCIKNSNSLCLTPPVWMLYLVRNNQKKYFSHSEFYEKAIEADVLSQLFFWLWEEVSQCNAGELA